MPPRDALDEQLARQLYDSAVYDGLTGLYNRRAFDERLRAELAFANRYGKPLALLIADIDHFKRINDEHGHPFGDQILREIESLKEVPGWSLQDGAITRTFEFPDYHRTMAFVNAVAWIAHQEDHHPDLAVSYSKCTVRYNTHSIGGISENDFICAAKIEALQG